jgi:uncharacterized protein
MKIVVNKVPPEGLTQHASYNPSVLDMDRQDVQLKEPFEADAFVTKADQELVVNVEIRAPLHLVCGRCLEEFTSMVTPRAVFSYTVQPTGTVDITDDVRQEIILAYPMIPLCKPDCKGLCRSCGQNLNVTSCSHQEQEVSE